MEKQHFMIRLIAPRPSFSFDMNEMERALMDEHIAYWAGLTKQGTSILFGPVFDPAGPYGMGVIEVTDEAAAKELIEQDPTMKSNTGFSYSVYAMRIGMIRKEN